MGITRDSRHKHRLTGGKVNVHKKKRKFELGRPMSSTTLGQPRVRPVRTRGGNMKFRALRLDKGNFCWGSENTTRKVRIGDVVYNSSNNELVRTKTLVKNAIVMVDATPFRHWYMKNYGIHLGKKETKAEEAKLSGHAAAKLKYKQQKNNSNNPKLDSNLEDQFNGGRLLACIASRPGQSGRADGYILEGDELAFYKRKMDKKKHK